jgi:predicted amidohydrolase
VTCSIAAAQTVPRPGDVDANVDEHVRLVRLAEEQQAHVLVFPELSLTGYELDLADELAFSEDDARLAPLAAAAAFADTTLVVGAPARVGSRLHIGAFILAPDGSVDLYTKRHLGAFAPIAGRVVPPPEDVVFEPGERDPLVQLGDRSSAVAVCADTGHLAHAQQAADRGATFYLASMFAVPADLEAEAERLRSHARRHSMVVVMANFGGPTGGLASGGQSAIWDERGALLAQLPEAGAGVVVAVEEGSVWRASAIKL